jgi:serine/threonine-protein kinase
MQACLSLAEAHESGLVHRDIKPANLFICKLGLEVDVLKVLDFGIVKWAAREAVAVTMPADQTCGTPAFMSPEASTNPASLDGQADVYALGCVAYWLLTGEIPFDAPTTTGLLMKHVLEAPVPPSVRTTQPIPQALEHLVMRCLSKTASERPTALELYSLIAATGLSRAWTREKSLIWWNERIPEVMAGLPLTLRRPPLGSLHRTL